MKPAEPNDDLFQPIVNAVTEGGTSPDAELRAFEHTAAALHGAHAKFSPERPPEALVRRLKADLEPFVRPRSEPTNIVPLHPSFPWIFRFSWIATAACLAFALHLWTTRVPSLESQRAELLAAPDLIRLTLKPGGAGDTKASAELFWSTSRQTGFLDLRELRPNDPAREQYQLWIVDPLRDSATPVDAGVFNVDPQGSALVRFQPKLPVLSPSAFAVTREQPGGVVKSRASAPVLVASVR